MSKFDLNKVRPLELPKSVSKWVEHNEKGLEKISSKNIKTGVTNNVSRNGASKENMVREKKNSLSKGWDYIDGKPVINVHDYHGNVYKADGFTKTEAAILLGWIEIPEYKITLKEGAPVEQIVHFLGLWANTEKSHSSPATNSDYIKHLVEGVGYGWFEADVDIFDSIMNELAPFMSDPRKNKIVGKSLNELGNSLGFITYTSTRIKSIQSKFNTVLNSVVWKSLEISNIDTIPHTPIKNSLKTLYGRNLKKGYEQREYFESISRFQETGHHTYFVGHCTEVGSVSGVWKQRMNIVNKLKHIEEIYEKAGILYKPCFLIGFLPQLTTESNTELISIESVREYFALHSNQGVKAA